MSAYDITSRDSGYGAPEAAYEEPAAEYGGYETVSGPGSQDITPVLIGLLVVTGLALLFPSYVTLTNVRRRRRSVGSSESGHQVSGQ